MNKIITMVAAACCLATVLSACEDEPPQPLEPQISSITVEDALHREQATVDVRLINPGGAELRVKDVTMAYRPTSVTAGAFLPAEEIALDSAGTGYSGQLPPLSIGGYEVRVTAVFGPMPDVDNPTPMGPDTIKTATQNFSVAPGGEACFTFATPEEVNQWTHGGFIDHVSGDQICEGDLMFTTTDGGSASVPVSNQCVNPEGVDFYRFDLISPDISANTEWQPASMSGVFVSAGSANPNEIQAIVGTNANRSFANIGSDGAYAFTEVGNGMVPQPVEMTFGDLPQDEAITQVRIRVFGNVEAGRSIKEGFFRLGAVCALP